MQKQTNIPATTIVTGTTTSAILAQNPLNLRETAQLMQTNGLSVLPIGKAKRPAVRWKEYQQTPATLEQVRVWFNNPNNLGVAVITGAVSGNLEMLEIEGTSKNNHEADPKPAIALTSIQAEFDAYGAGELFTRVFVGRKRWSECTPSGGLHFYYRVQGMPVSRNTKLACNSNGEIVIETRGEGGYSIVAPTPNECHNTPELIAGGWGLTCTSPTPWEHIPIVNVEEYRLIHKIMRSFNQRPEPEETLPTASVHMVGQETLLEDNRWIVRPGDDFNNKASWPKILEPYGWQFNYQANGQGFWTRPGKDVREGASATTNYAGNDCLWVFSTSTCFPIGKSISKFWAHTILNHNGDGKASAKALAEQGYGTPKTQTEQESPAYTVADPACVNAEVGAVEKNTGNKNVIHMIPLSEIQMKSIEYFWQNFIPLNTVTIFTGKGGCGKSTYLAHIMAKASKGELDGAHKGTPINIGIYSIEDNMAMVTVPRYKVNGADLTRVHTFTLDRDPDNFPTLKVPTHIHQLEEVIRRYHLKALVLDPVARTQIGKQDKAQDVQELISELVRLATRTGCTIIGVHHNKKGGGVADESMSGSHQWRDSARGVIVFAEDPDTGNRVFQVNKLNGGLADLKPYAFQLVSAEYVDGEGRVSTAGRVVEQGESHVSVEALINRMPDSVENSTKVGALARFLREQLASGQKVTRSELEKRAREAGIDENRRTWSRALKDIGAKSERDGNTYSYWLE